jgi:hypothetical protein
VGKNKELRKKRESFQRQIDKHERKLEQLLRTPNPNPGRVRKWRRDIEILRVQLEEVERKLPQNR